MPEYVLHIKVKGSDDGGSRVISGLQRGLSGIATVAGGIIAADVFYKIAGGIGSLVKNSIAAASSIQELTIALETLVAREIKQTEDWAMQTSRVRTSMTKKQREELGNLTDDYGVLTARIQEQKQKIYEWTQVWTDEPALKVETARAQLQKMENDAAKMQSRIAELNSIEGQWVTTTDKVQVGNMLLTDALSQAAPKAQELLKYLRDLSLLSPYQFADVANTFRFSMALGATTDQAKEMTGATMDMAAALGLRNEQLHRLQYNLAQGIFAGDLTMVNLRQLKLVGLDLAGILEQELGMSLQEVRDQMKAGKLDSEDLAKAFSDHVDKYYAGAAERMTKTWGGLTNNLKDLMFFLGADLIGPALDVVTGALGGLFDKAREMLESGKIAELGEALATILEAVVAGDISGAFDALAEGLGSLGVSGDVVRVIGDLGLFVEAFKSLMEGDVDAFIVDFARGIGEFAENIGLVDALKATEITSAIIDFGREIKTFADEAWQKFKDIDFSEFSEAFAVLKEGDIEGFISSLAGAIGNLGEQVLGISPETAAAVAGAIGTVGDSMWITAQNIGEFVAATAETTWKTFMEWWQDNGPAVDAQVGKIASSFERLVSALSDDEVGIENLDKMMESLTAFSTDEMNQALTNIDLVTDAFEGLAGAAEWIRGALDDVVEAVPGFAGSMDELEGMFRPVLDIIENIIKGINTLSMMGDAWKDVKENFPKASEFAEEEGGWWEAGKSAIKSWWGGVEVMFSGGFGNLPELPVKDVFPNADDGGTIGTVFASAMKDSMVTEFQLVPGALATPLGDTNEAITGAWENTMFLLTGNSIIPDMMAAIVGLFDDLSADLESPLGEVYTTITKKMGEILTFIKGEIPKYVAAGEDMALGIKKGVKKKWSEVKETFKIKLTELVKSILAELGIGSPSKVMADIGENMVEGLEVGILERWPGLEGAVTGKVSALANLIGVKLGWGLISAARRIAAEEERFFGSVLVDIGNRLMSIGMAFSKRYEDLYLGPLQEQIDSIEEAMADAKREGHLEEYLALEAQRNVLAAEYEEIQARTLRLQQAQQSLQFLQQQVQLIELIKEYGLDAKAILQGMTLGLGASTDELVDAISKALEMIIAQTEKTLQLGSPSKLFWGFGKDIMQGLARGISSVKVEVPNPGYSDNGRGAQRIDQRNVTFNQTMNVTTGATSPEVQRDWGIMTHLAPTYSR